jgi:hypothetical protein
MGLGFCVQKGCNSVLVTVGDRVQCGTCGTPVPQHPKQQEIAAAQERQAGDRERHAAAVAAGDAEQRERQEQLKKRPPARAVHFSAVTPHGCEPVEAPAATAAPVAEPARKRK